MAFPPYSRVSFSIPMLIRGVTLRYGFLPFLLGIVFDTYVDKEFTPCVPGIVFDTCGCVDVNIKYIDYTSFYCWVSKTIPRYHYMAFLAIGYRKRYPTVGNIRFLGYFCNI